MDMNKKTPGCHGRSPMDRPWEVLPVCFWNNFEAGFLSSDQNLFVTFQKNRRLVHRDPQNGLLKPYNLYITVYRRIPCLTFNQPRVLITAYLSRLCSKSFQWLWNWTFHEDVFVYKSNMFTPFGLGFGAFFTVFLIFTQKNLRKPKPKPTNAGLNKINRDGFLVPKNEDHGKHGIHGTSLIHLPTSLIFFRKKTADHRLVDDFSSDGGWGCLGFHWKNYSLLRLAFPVPLRDSPIRKG